MECREALERVNMRWNDAIASGDADSVSGLCTDDVILLVQGTPMARGIPEVKALCRRWASAGKFDETQQTVACGRDGGLAYLAGTYVRRIELGAGKFRAATGKFLAVYKRQADGEWKTHIVSVFAD